MLYITRKPGESVLINDNIQVKIIEIKGKIAKLGFVVSSEATVLRQEVYERIRQETERAAQSVQLIKEDLA